MDPLKYRRPIFVNPPFRDPLVAALAESVGDQEVRHLDRLLPLLDGTHGVADIYARLVMDGISPAFVQGALDTLDRLGCLAESPTTSDHPTEAAAAGPHRNQVSCLEEWLKVRHEPEEARSAAVRAQSHLAEARVLVMGLGRCGGALIEALAQAGVGHLLGIRTGNSPDSEDPVADRLHDRIASLPTPVQYREVASVEDLDMDGAESDGPPLLVYCPDVFHEGVCEELNRLVLGMGSSLLIYRESPFTIELGPLVVAGQTACYTCYQLRRRAAEGAKPEPEETQVAETFALNFSVGVPLLALEIVKYLTRAAFPVTRGKLWRLGLFDGSVGVHPVLKLPRCPSCGGHRVTPPRRVWEE